MTIRSKIFTFAGSLLALALVAPLAHADPDYSNRVLNGGFEYDSNQIINGWTLGGNAKFDNSTVFAGQNSLEFSGTDSSAGSVSQFVRLLPIDDYALSFYAKGNRDALTLKFGSNSFSLANFDISPKDNDWYFYEGLINLVSDGDLSFGFNSSVARAAYLDNVSLNCVDNNRGGVCAPAPTGSTVPEPGSLLLVGGALAAIATVRRRKQV